MNNDQILARARQEVQARRSAEVERRWGGRRRDVLLLLVVSVLLSFAVAPGSLPEKLLWLMGGVCSLRPSHSYFAGTTRLPLEARMVGIYGGFLVTFGLLLGFKRLGARRIGNRVTNTLLALMFASMAFDGVNSTLMELRLPHLYTTTNVIRLVTGLLSGIALAVFLVWLVSFVLLGPASNTRPMVLRSPWDVAAVIALNAVFAALVVSGQGWLYYPIAIAGVAGIVAILASTALLVIATLGDLEGGVVQARQIVGPGALALLVAFTVLAGTAALRWSLVGSV